MGCSWSSTKQEIIDEYAKLRDQAATDRVEAELERGTYHTPRLHGEAGTCPRNTDDDEGLVSCVIVPSRAPHAAPAWARIVF